MMMEDKNIQKTIKTQESNTEERSDRFFLDQSSRESEALSPSLEATQESALFKSILKGVFARSRDFIQSVKRKPSHDE